MHTWTIFRLNHTFIPCTLKLFCTQKFARFFAQNTSTRASSSFAALQMRSMYAISINIHALNFKIFKGIGLIAFINVKHLHWLTCEKGRKHIEIKSINETKRDNV